MDANNLQLTNNFSDGMNTDTSDAFLSESSYRLANNLRFITNEQENSGELHMIEGTTKDAQISFEDETIIATTSLRDIPIYVTLATNKLYWKVYYGDTCCVKIDGDERVIDTKLSLVARYESDDNKHLYIADGKGPVLCIQLTNIQNLEYSTPLRDVESVPQVLFKKPIFCGLINGNIKAAVVEYSYLFYKKYGQQSEISPSTKLIPLFKGDVTAKNSSKILGYLPDEQSSKGVRIKIRYDANTITPFDRIKIFRVSYLETGQLPQIECVYDEKIPSGTELTFDDIGNNALSVYSLEEYNSMTGIHIIPKTIESKDDYLFAANVKDDSTGFDISGWNKGNVKFKTVTVDLIGDNSIDPNEVLAKPKTELLSDSILTSDGKYNITEYIEPEEDLLYYGNPQVSYMFRSFRRGEKYRFGIIFYDKKGRSSGVIHLEDKEINTDDDFFYIRDGKLIVKPVGIKFEIYEFPEGAVSYEIVRCGRSVFDIQTISQGFLSRPIAKQYSFAGVKQNYPLTPTGIVSLHDIVWKNSKNQEGREASVNVDIESLGSANYKYDGNYNTFQFISPEICFTEDTIKDVLSQYELKLEPIKYVCPQVFSKEVTDSDLTLVTVSEEYSRWRINYGNKYANIIWSPQNSTKHCNIHTYGYDTIITDYMTKDLTALNLSGGSDFKEQDYNGIEKRYAYSKLYYTYDNMPLQISGSFDISSIGFPETLNWDDFATPVAEKFELIYPDKVTAVGGRNYVNWVCGSLYGKTDLGSDRIKLPESDSNTSHDTLADGSYYGICTMGPGGKCAVISINDENRTITNSIPDTSLVGTYICNLRKKSIPGSDDVSIKNSIYRSFGDYFDASVTEGYIFDGDCFILPFEYIALHKFAHPSSVYWRNACKIFVVPLETSINLAYTSGYEFNKEFNSASGDITFILNNAGNVNNYFIQDRPLYSYNSVYSSNDVSKSYVSAESMNFEDNPNTDCRVFHSNVKTNNEYVDNWLKFMPANFLDVDTRLGPITGLRTFKNQLVFWQEHATGVLSVNERSVISDESNMPLILGSGGVLTRFDYITNTNGMYEDEYSDAQSNTTLYWWDRINKSLCGYSGGQDAIELSKIKFVLNYLNKNEPEDNPVVAYDNKTKELIANVVQGKNEEFGSLVYNEHLGHFTSLYTIKPEHKVELPDGLLLTTNNSVYKWNVLDMDGVYGFGNELKPYLKHTVNKGFVTTKVFDNAEFGGRVYGGDDLSKLTLTFSTPLKQYAELEGSKILNREYNFRYIIPRNGDNENYKTEYGDRLRGKTMQCELKSSSNSYDLSLQYITTKFRASWS